MEQPLVYAFMLFWNEATRSVMQLATFLKLYVHQTFVKCETLKDVKGT